MRRVLVTGSRNWSDIKTLYDALSEELLVNGPFILVHGGCATGADRLAENWGLWAKVIPSMNVTIEKHSADWSKGSSAGPIRNQRMVDLGADVCLAFPKDDSRGTLDCIRRARAAKIPVKVFHEGKKSFMDVRSKVGHA